MCIYIYMYVYVICIFKYVCMYVCLYVCMYIYMHRQTHRHKDTQHTKPQHTHTHITSTPRRKRTSSARCVHIHAYIYTYLYTLTYTHVDIHIHHTQRLNTTRLLKGTGTPSRESASTARCPPPAPHPKRAPQSFPRYDLEKGPPSQHCQHRFPTPLRRGPQSCPHRL